MKTHRLATQASRAVIDQQCRTRRTLDTYGYIRPAIQGTKLSGRKRRHSARQRYLLRRIQSTLSVAGEQKHIASARGDQYVFAIVVIEIADLEKVGTLRNQISI